MPICTPVIYFHGMPGSPRELDLFEPRLASGAVYAPDRNERGRVSTSDYLSDLAGMIRTKHPAGKVRIISFSLGALPAVEVAARLGPLVSGIDMVSPAAPLETGDYPTMAGRAVFKLAKQAPRLFSRLTMLQAFAAQHAGNLLYTALFASARGADRQLARSQHFRATMMEVLADCFRNGAAGYRAELLDYVRAQPGIRLSDFSSL